MSGSNGMRISYVNIPDLEIQWYWVGRDGVSWPRGDNQRSGRTDPAIVEDISVEDGVVKVWLRSIEPTFMGQMACISRHLAGCTVYYEGQVPTKLDPDLFADPADNGNLKHKKFVDKAEQASAQAAKLASGFTGVPMEGGSETPPPPSVKGGLASLDAPAAPQAKSVEVLEAELALARARAKEAAGG